METVTALFITAKDGGRGSSVSNVCQPVSQVSKSNCFTYIPSLRACREHDKGPEKFCALLESLIGAEADFVVSVLGTHTNDIPGAREILFHSS